MTYEGDNYQSPIAGLIGENLGPAPEGVSLVDYAIATLPPRALTRAAKDSTFSYEGLLQLTKIDPDFLDKYNADPHLSKALADEILVRQQQLSRHRRRLATAASALALGFGAFGASYELGQQPHSLNAEPSKEYTQFAHDSRNMAIVIGGLGAVLGGFVGGFVSLSFSGRLAKRPAQKLVNKATV